MTLGTFLKVHPPTFRGTSNPTDADNWIQEMERALQAQQVPEEQWVEFGTYQLQGEAQNAKELELMQLKQGQMTVTEYTSRFEDLCHFSRICQGALEYFAEWKCIKYEGGLQSDILSFVALMEIRVFSELVNKSRVAEECVRKAAAEKGSLRVPFQRTPGRNFALRGRNFKRGGFVPQQNQGRPGHLVSNCPEKKKYETGRIQQPGRVYTTSAVGAEGFEILIRGYDLKVHNATHEAMVTRLGCPQVPFRVQQREFVHDLICLPMTGLDLILGLDLLSKNHVLLDCSEKSVQFMPEGSEVPVVMNSYYLNSMIVNCSGNECQDVFPDDINEFSPNREVKFAIELVLGAGLILITS
ncbi:uncharacterized protein LOC107641434 [Arachis ipaensis]|uniref:uncharacterized protein LOC107641434 n=1 Tax=Arachis ipaensis TaxID=130454 RepID=UPI0007AF2DA2|nr:uncharacterized protein LOC107641434 [Arachis ipaensis]